MENNMRIFDSHCHLQDERIIAEADHIIAKAKDAGIVRMLCCGTRESDWDAVKTLSERHPEVVPAFGLHPWFVNERSERWLERLEAILTAVPRAAMGEIGLDHAIEKRDDEVQVSVFTAQLRLARRLRRPVSVHCRKAWGAMMEILERQCGFPDQGVMHSYSGPPDLVPRLERLNASLSFSGSITYERNCRGHASLEAASEHAILVETDSPDLPPEGIEKEQNEPAQCAAIVKTMAKIRNIPLEIMGDITYQNAARIFTGGDAGVYG